MKFLRKQKTRTTPMRIAIAVRGNALRAMRN